MKYSNQSNLQSDLPTKAYPHLVTSLLGYSMVSVLGYPSTKYLIPISIFP